MSGPALLAVLLLQAAPAAPPAAAPQAAPAQPQGVAPPPEFIQSAQAFGQCVGQASGALPATVTPEAGAKQALAACAAQKATMEQRFESWVAGPNFPEAGRPIAREQFRTQIAGVETQIADDIRRARATPAGATPAPATTAAPAPAATSTPSPAPSATPTPTPRPRR